MQLPPFIPGIELSRRFYHEVLRPILEQHYPHLPHAAALIGFGSDVLGFDTPMSRDHFWGPRAWIFVQDGDAHLEAELTERLRHTLPREFLGYPVGFDESPHELGTLLMGQSNDGPVNNHLVFVTTVRNFVQHELAYDLDQPLEVADWLTFPAQKLRAITAGAVHYDSVGELTAIRERLQWYPHDVWLYLLAAGWQRIGQEEHLMPRAGDAGDEPGSALIGSRLVRDIMMLCFLMERQYAPYPKWFGAAFKQLRCADHVEPALWRAQQAATWREREAALAEAYTRLAQMHNALGITPPLHENVSEFFGRPFKVIWGSRFAEAIVEQISDSVVKQIAAQPLIGSIDQWSDSTDLRSNARWRSVLRQLYVVD